MPRKNKKNEELTEVNQKQPVGQDDPEYTVCPDTGLIYGKPIKDGSLTVQHIYTPEHLQTDADIMSVYQGIAIAFKIPLSPGLAKRVYGPSLVRRPVTDKDGKQSFISERPSYPLTSEQKEFVAKVRADREKRKQEAP